MKTDYSKLPREKQYDIFRNSDFSKIVDDKFSAFAIKGGRRCSIAFLQVTDNPDVVSLSCFDLDGNKLCKGTPEAGKHLLARRAYEDFTRGFSNSEDVKRALKKIDEFMYDVKVGTSRAGV